VKFVGLRSKCYCIQFQDEVQSPSIKVAKGVQKSTKKKQLDVMDYERALDYEDKIVKEVKLVSKKMEMCVIEQSKLALCVKDDKRVWKGKSDQTSWPNTFAHGHYSI